MSHKERLLKYYKFIQNQNANMAIPTTVTSIPPIPAEITHITLRRINSDDRVDLKATIEWSLDLTVTAGTFFTVPQLLTAFQQATFQIWRDAVNTGTLVAQYTDQGFVNAVLTVPAGGTAATGSSTASITTTIVATDSNVPHPHTHRYFLSVTVPGPTLFTTAGTATPSPVIIVPVTASGLSFTPRVTAYSFDGSVIDENNT